MKLDNKIWYILAGLFAVPFIIPMILPEPFATISIIGIMIGALFWLRSRVKGVAQSMLQTKMVWVCSSCNQPSKEVECKRCGSKSRKLR